MVFALTDNVATIRMLIVTTISCVRQAVYRLQCSLLLSFRPLGYADINTSFCRRPVTAETRVLGPSMWYVRWSKLHCLSSTLSVSSHQCCILIRSSHHRPCIILAIDEAIKSRLLTDTLDKSYRPIYFSNHSLSETGFLFPSSGCSVK
jgi:hypothetical protein